MHTMKETKQANVIENDGKEKRLCYVIKKSLPEKVQSKLRPTQEACHA